MELEHKVPSAVAVLVDGECLDDSSERPLRNSIAGRLGDEAEKRPETVPLVLL